MFSKEKDTPCRICMAIRIFLLSVLTIALLTFIDRSISCCGQFKAFDYRFDFGRRVGLFCTFEIRV